MDEGFERPAPDPSQTAVRRRMVPRAAIVGAGPAGFYSAEQLLRKGFAVDLFDALPTPFGLVRFGVAPDHPKIKSVGRVFERTAAHQDFRFFGGVELGEDIYREELLNRYNAVVYAVGTSADNRLGIAGEDRPGCHAATDFVAWYNGHPDHADRRFDLAASRAVVIGNGNVAIDIARMLVLEPDELARTDAADHAIESLRHAGVEHVTVLGRRGPTQATFTLPELRELGRLGRTDVLLDPAELEPDEASRGKLELLGEYARREPKGGTHRIELRFLRSPVEVLGDGPDGRVTGIRVVRNRLETDDRGRLVAVPTGKHELLACGLVLRSIGYRGRRLPGVPFDDRRGVIYNEGGRVVDPTDGPRRGEYVVGWIKRGPSGVIGTKKKDAADTVARLLEDRDSGRLLEPARLDSEAIEPWLRTQSPGLVTWSGWQAIDEHEMTRGRREQRPRVKLVRIPDMLASRARPRRTADGVE